MQRENEPPACLLTCALIVLLQSQYILFFVGLGSRWLLHLHTMYFKRSRLTVLFHHTVVCTCVSDHFTQMLHCEHECVRDLATRPGRLSPMENYLPLHYDYLQFAYFHGENTVSLAIWVTN